MLTDAQRETLVAACDTIVPSLERADDPDGFFARPSSATGAPIAIEQAISAMPAANAAAIWPVKMASGKFQGEMQAKTPRPCNSSALVSPTGPLRIAAPANCRSARRP